MSKTINKQQLNNIFGPGGLLEQKLPQFENRTSQRRLAHEIAGALDKQQILAAEAGTGTGKTFSYLVPLLLLGKAKGEVVVVSTYTKSLQLQLYHKDLPLIINCLDLQVNTALLMGRNNYACHKNLYNLAATNPQFLSWALETERGSQEEWPFDLKIWPQLAAIKESCLGRYCQYQKQCFVNKAREKANAADVIVINHSLFYSNLKMNNSQEGSGFLPDFKYIVFDEAQNLESVGIEQFKEQFSQKQLQVFLNDLLQPLNDLSSQEKQGLYLIIKEFNEVVSSFFYKVQAQVNKNQLKKFDLCWSEAYYQEENEITLLFERLIISLNNIKKELNESLSLIIEAKIAQAKTMKKSFLFFFSGALKYVFFLAEENKDLMLRALPLTINSIWEKAFFPQIDACVFTSATLAIGQDMSFFKASLGLPPQRTIATVLPSPFAYQKMVKVLIPKDLPSPQQKDFEQQSLAFLKAFLPFSGVRTLILFTSYRMLENIASLGHREFKKLGFQVFKQTKNSSTEQLLADFKQAPKAVLLGTSTFWEGIDLPRDNLTSLVLMRMPFPVPDEPWILGKAEQLQQHGQNSFFKLMLPVAVLKFKQGFGRLIRTEQDRGLICILDHRVMIKNYGGLFRKALPPGLDFIYENNDQIINHAQKFWQQ